MSIKIYRLKKDINSPNFTRTIEAGRIYTSCQLKSTFHVNETSYTFKDWFEDVSDEYEIKGCMIVRKSDEATIKSTACLVWPSGKYRHRSL